MNDWKGKLRQACAHLASVNSTEEKDLRDMCLLINNWNWKLTASGCFDVNKELISGVGKVLYRLKIKLQCI